MICADDTVSSQNLRLIHIPVYEYVLIGHASEEKNLLSFDTLE